MSVHEELEQTKKLVEQQAEELKEALATIEQMRAALHQCERAVCSAQVSLIVAETIALQPCPEVLNKVQADAMKEVITRVGAHHLPYEIKNKMLDYVKLVEKGEV